MTGQDDFFESFPGDQDFISASDFGFWDETLVSEGELGDFEFPLRDGLSEEEERTPLEDTFDDPFLVLFDEDDLQDT